MRYLTALIAATAASTPPRQYQGADTTYDSLADLQTALDGMVDDGTLTAYNVIECAVPADEEDEITLDAIEMAKDEAVVLMMTSPAQIEEGVIAFSTIDYFARVKAEESDDYGYVMAWVIRMPNDFHAGVDYSASFEVAREELDEGDWFNGECDETSCQLFTQPITCSDCDAAPDVRDWGWSDSLEMDDFMDDNDLELAYTFRPNPYYAGEEMLEDPCTDCVIESAAQGSYIYIDMEQIGPSTIGDCSIAGDAIDSDDILVQGIVEPHLDSEAYFVCGALIKVSQNADPSEQYEFVFTHNGNDINFIVEMFYIESDEDEEEEEESEIEVVANESGALITGFVIGIMLAAGIYTMIHLQMLPEDALVVTVN